MAKPPGTRMLILTLETICEIFKDYVSLAGFPQDAKPVKFMFNPQEKKVAIVVDSEEVKDGQVEEIKFDIRRVYGVS